MIIVGHRGGAGLGPENTLQVINMAHDHAVDEIEVDLRVTKDGFVVINHDPVLTDYSGKSYVINQTNLKDLKQTKPDILRLCDLFKSAKPNITLYLEIKPDEPIESVMNAIKRGLSNGWPASKLKIGSFDINILREVHKKMPEIELIVIEGWIMFRAKKRADRVDTKYIAINQSFLTSGMIKRLTKKGYKIYAYTMDDTVKASKWQKAGLYGVITDYPNKFVKL
jgi:glycerophosphoryl diester phosphodiesterase